MTAAFCPACRRSSPAFEPVGDRPEARCPRCQGVERNRFAALLFEALEPWLADGRRRVLEVAPQPIMRNILTGRFGAVDYVAIDLLEDRAVDVWADLTRLPFADGAFDLVLCSHVLEHVRDDRAAMRELARVTSPDGLVVVFVPYRADEATDEGPLRKGETNESRFGQGDHVRWYGADLDDRLLEEGLRPLRLTPEGLFTPDEIARFRLVPDERVWLCTPAAAGDAAASPTSPLPALLRGRVGDLRDAGLLVRGPDDELRDVAAVRRRADAVTASRDHVTRLEAERDAALQRAEQAEDRYRRLSSHPAVRALRRVRRLLR